MMKLHPLPPTINLHNLIPCNFKCGFCYAGFASAGRTRIPQTELHEILRQISAAPLPGGLLRRKVTFAGGEPLLSPTVVEDITHARSLGLVTSLVTNGSLLSEEKLRSLYPALDWLTISIDSLDAETNRRIGRANRGVVLSADEYLAKLRLARSLGIRVKINTVVNQANAAEDMIAFMREARPLRWKLFQATRIAGENGSEFDRWGVSEAVFRDYVARHAGVADTGVVLVPETQADIYGTYAMIGPNGCFFDNSQGDYRYSRPIVSVGVEAAWAEITFSSERFQQRQGDYDFKTGSNRKEVA